MKPGKAEPSNRLNEVGTKYKMRCPVVFVPAAWYGHTVIAGNLNEFPVPLVGFWNDVIGNKPVPLASVTLIDAVIDTGKRNPGTYFDNPALVTDVISQIVVVKTQQDGCGGSSFYIGLEKPINVMRPAS